MNRVIFIILPLLFIFSCEKTEEDTKPEFIIIAGKTEHDFLLHQRFDPVITVLGTKHGTENDYFYNDSVRIDLNSDNIEDIQFSIYKEFFQPDCNCEGIDCCMPFGSSKCFVESLTNVEFVIDYYDGFWYPKRLNLGDTINKKLEWQSAANKKAFSFWGMNNEWEVDNYKSFIGFRINNDSDTKYGWIRLNTFGGDRIDIYEYVIEAGN